MVVLIWISLMSEDGEHHFIYLFAIYIPSLVCRCIRGCIWAFCPYFNQVFKFFSYGWVLKLCYIFWKQVVCHIFDLWICLSCPWLVFSFCLECILPFLVLYQSLEKDDEAIGESEVLRVGLNLPLSMNTNDPHSFGNPHTSSTILSTIPAEFFLEFGLVSYLIIAGLL